MSTEKEFDQEVEKIKKDQKEAENYTREEWDNHN